MISGSDPKNVILIVILRFADFKHSDWLKYVEQPIRMFKDKHGIFYAQHLFVGLAPFYFVVCQFASYIKKMFSQQESF